jgi:pimeloyl-ACP methyl ester carboxylesterase
MSDVIHERTVSVWEGRLNIRVKVAGDGPALVFLHGSFGGHWDGLLARLAENYTVYAPEFPGTSPADPDAIHAIDELSDLVLAYEELIRRLDLVKPVLVGHAFGGMLAAEVAATFPDLTDTLVLIAPVGLWRDDVPVASWGARPGHELPGLLFHDPTSAPALAWATPPEDPEAAVAAAAGLLWSIGCTGKFTWPVPDRGLHRRLHRIAAMTLVVWGGEDRVVPAAYADEFTRLVPHATVAIVDEAGHLPQVERLDDTWKTVGGFLRCLDPAPALS